MTFATTIAHTLTEVSAHLGVALAAIAALVATVEREPDLVDDEHRAALRELIAHQQRDIGALPPLLAIACADQLATLASQHAHLITLCERSN